MVKSDLVRLICEQRPDLYQRDVEKIVDAMIGEITAALARGDRVEIRGFGVFTVRKRPARSGRNPRNGSIVAVEAKGRPFFKSAKEMRLRLNRSAV
jgi:integration host factor subunit beta